MGRSGPHPATSECGPFGRKVAGFWERERRYEVPRWLIERATERRLAGDWRGACREAGVVVGFDLARVASEHGTGVAEALENDLLYLAPDLLRWHLSGDADRYELAAYGDLRLFRPRPRPNSLEFGPARPGRFLAPGYVWDVRRAGEILARHGGRGRAPFFEADGTPREAAESPGDPVGWAERVSVLHERGLVEDAFAEAGIRLQLHPDDPQDLDERRWKLGMLPLALHRIEAEVGLLGGGRFRLNWPLQPFLPLPRPTEVSLMSLLLEALDDGLRVTYVRNRADLGPEPLVALPELFWHRSPDLDLVRAGRLTPDELHPLVREALFPGRDAAGGGGPGESAPPKVARVRCGDAWHEVSFERGALRIRGHTDEERRWEEALRAFGGKVAGCFAVRQSWDGAGFLPRALREQRRELFRRVERGDTEGVLRCLDVGYDAHARDGDGRSLLHWLHVLDHEVLLPRLLDEGFDLEARDFWDRTPLVAAVLTGAPAPAVRALVDAGARTDVRSAAIWGAESLAEAVHRVTRTGQDFLR
ncbi:ankyrin repeat domain-containing protein [Actinomadura rugatobispora]|uniref:Ankyrin repeat domain-containing protein n=1 Tax=Actinomadura rugatobispora TaxID=1994 RepID=A0ABW1AB18_9ACTN|nr:hypothetical protein GCM10010200_048090 [Actinomadura rugatobispora]